MFYTGDEEEGRKPLQLAIRCWVRRGIVNSQPFVNKEKLLPQGMDRHFTHLHTGEPPKDRTALFATLLADAINLGLSQMAETCEGMTFNRLAWVADWMRCVLQVISLKQLPSSMDHHSSHVHRTRKDLPGPIFLYNLAHIAPLGWEQHINLIGKYQFAPQPGRSLEKLRPLRLQEREETKVSQETAS